MRSKRYPLALMPYWVLAIAMGMVSQAASAARCDVDADRDIDRIDIVSIRQAVGTPASGVNDPRDADGNGRILRNDELLCARRCTLPLCDLVSPDSPEDPPNVRPVARRDSARTAEDTSVRINLIANDRDPDGRLVAKSIKIVTRPRHGRVRNHRNGTVTYTPASGFTGRDRFRYRVRDDDEARSRAARVRIIVERGNHPPLADAGSDTNTTTGLPVTLNGSGSSDPDGDPLAFLWRFLSVPPPSTVTDASLANGNTAAPRFTPDVDGPYELALEASDGAMSDVDTIVVTARAANVPPNANAGPDASAVAGQLVHLDGRGSTDPDNGPAALGFHWSFAALPAGSFLSDIDIAGASTALASFTPDFAGDYRISLEVNDGTDTGRDEVLISAALPNVTPNAAAGADLVVQLGAGATLDGAASNDPDNGPAPLSFQWAFVSVPVGSVLTDADLAGATTAAPSFTPDIAGFYVLRLEVSDGDLTDTDQVMVKANVAPTAVDDPRTLVENTSLTEPAPGVLGNDTDGNNDVLTSVLDSGPMNGTLTLNADGSFTYTPGTDFEGTDSFTYHANDGSADSSPATVTITVTHANEAPVAVDDAYTTDEDTPLVVAAVPGVLGNDSDFESDPLTAVVDTAPASGTLTLDPDGSFTYTPNPDFNGTDSFTYHANDGSSDSNVATVALTIDVVNDAPAFTVGPNQTVLEGVGAQTVDPWATGISPGPANESSQTVSFNITGNTNPGLFSAGPAISSSGVLTYTPAPTTSGSATLTLALSDNGGTANGGVDTSAPQTFTITVDNVNDAPSFTVGTDQTVHEDAGPQPVDPWASAISAGPGESGQTVAFIITGNTNPGLFSTGPAISPVGILTYTPAPNANGSATVTLVIQDNGGTANGGIDTSAPQSFTITVNAVNDAPAFNAGPNQTVNEDPGAQTASGWATGISPGPADESGQTVGFNITGNNNPGLFSAGPAVSPGGDLTYEPAANASGVATITLTLSDNGGLANGGADTSAPQIFTITVNDINDPPAFTAGPDQTVNEDAGAQTVNPWATALSAGPGESGQTVAFNITGNTNPSLFSAGPSVSPTGVLTYTPAANASGSASITLALSDDGGIANGGDDTSDSQSFTITANAVNDAPAFTAGPNQTVNEDAGAQSVSGWATGISPGPTDESGQTVSFNVTGNTNPSLFSAPPSVSPSGVLSYAPAASAFGIATITLSLSDSGGTANSGIDTSAAQNFTITVNAVNDAPSFTAGGSQNVLEDAGLVTVNPWATGISPGPANESGQTVGFNITGNTNPGLFAAGPAVSPAGVLSFTPAPNAFGSATLTLVLQDNGGTANGGVDISGSQGFTITVLPVNDAPVATAKSHQTHSGIRVTIGAGDTGRLKDGATDVDDPFGDLVVNASFSGITPAGATIVLTDATTGTFTYNPPAGFSGAASFQFQVCDDGIPTPPAMCSALTTVSFTITGPDLWFVDDSAGAGGTGRLTDPFDALSDLPGGRGPGDRIFVFTGTYGGHTLLTNEQLIGQGSSGSFDTVLGVSVPGNGTLDGRPALGGTRPQLNGTVAAAAGNTVRGLNILTNVGTALTGNNFGTLTASEISVTGDNGAAINLITGNLAATFTRISSTGGSVPGINLSNTTGTFTVTGNGGSCTSAATCTGGSIANKTGSSEATGTPGVRLFNVTNFRLTRMNIGGNNHSGIYGGLVSNPSGAIDASTINGFQLDNCNITGNGDSNVSNPDETGVILYNLVGTASGGSNPTSITNTTISNNAEFQLQITNTASALTDLRMSGNAISSTGASGIVGNLVNFLALGTANMTLNLTSGTFTGAAPATATGLQCDHSGTSGTATCNVSGATFTNNNVATSVSQAQGGNLRLNVSNNTATGNRSHGLNLFVAASGTGTVDGSFNNNTVGTLNTAGSGSDLGFGIRIQNEGSTGGAPPVNVLVSGNTVQEMTSFAGINVNQGIAAQAATRATNATIINNVVREVDNSRAIIVQQNNSTAPGCTCTDISGNNMSNIAGNIGDGTKIRFRQLVGGTFNVRQQAPTAAANALELDDANSVGANITTPAQISIGGTATFNAGVCPLP